MSHLLKKLRYNRYSINYLFKYAQFSVEAASDTLQKVDLHIVDQRVCSTFYKDRNNRKLIRGIISEQMCAGDTNGGKDTCQVNNYPLHYFLPMVPSH